MSRVLGWCCGGILNTVDFCQRPGAFFFWSMEGGGARIRRNTKVGPLLGRTQPLSRDKGPSGIHTCMACEARLASASSHMTLLGAWSCMSTLIGDPLRLWYVCCASTLSKPLIFDPSFWPVVCIVCRLTSAPNVHWCHTI
jgi:hypothetical protein